MLSISRWTRVAFLPFVAGGCVAYHPKPLKPETELAALGRRSLEGFVVEHAKPGEGAASAKAPFDPSDGLNEAEAVAVALTLNPDLIARRLEVGEARALLIAAGVWPNPEVGIGWRPGIGNAAGFTVDADLLFELLKPWERAARKDVAAARLLEVKADIVADEWRVVAEVRSQLLEVLAAEQAVRLLAKEVSCGSTRSNSSSDATRWARAGRWTSPWRNWRRRRCGGTTGGPGPIWRAPDGR